jgi:ribonucleoside-triphosphate reductase
VEEIQDYIEEELMRSERKDVARAYIRYRFKKEMLRQTSETYSGILELVEMQNEELKDENSNKNAIVASTQRDYMAGEVSKDLSHRTLLPTEVIRAHDAGEIHFHDMDYFAQHIHNCCLVNLEDMFQNSTVINKTMIETPHSFSTVCNIATQIMAIVASGQYGGQTVTLSHLAPFVDVSRQKLKKLVYKDFYRITGKDVFNLTDKDELLIAELTEERVKEEIRKGVQTIQYQINTLNTSNGQTPFVTIFMYLNEVKDPRTKYDLALIIEEVLKQRIQGVKNEKGVRVTPAFPKLIYTLEDDNITEDSPYWYLTELAAKCTAKRLVPDYISEKVMLQLKKDAKGEGHCYPCMGCRSFLTPYLDENGDPKYYGRFNQGVVTINLVDVACSVDNESDFWDLLVKRLELCHLALQERHKRLEGTPSDISPVHWQYGALARLEKGETIDKLLHNGYSTLSLGYAGLWECVYKMTGHKLTEPEGKEFGLKVMRALNDACAVWKSFEKIDYSLYGTPIESTTYKFASCLKKKFGVIPGVTDKNYITNSYHVHVTEEIDAFSKIALEAEFQALSPGGAITYVEVPNLNNNIPAVIEVIKFIYDNIIYAELNTKSDYCQECDFDGEIQIVEDADGKLVWECPNCGNRNQDKMNVARRTCGYIGSNFWNQGRTQEIKERALHL